MNSWTWMRRKLLPSRSLGAYVGRLYVMRFLLILVLLATILQSLDLLNRSDKIMDAAGESDALVRYILWRFPQLVSQFIPFAALLAALFSFYTLANHSEVVIMRASGMAPGQVMAPMIVAGLGIAAAHFMFHDLVTVPSSAKLKYWEDSGYKMVTAQPSETRSNVWIADGQQVVEARSATQIVDGIMLQSVYVYTRDEELLLEESLAAEMAIYSEGHWTLINVRRFDLETHDYTTIENLPWQINLPIDQIFARTERPDTVRAAVLADAIKTLRRAGAETFTLETNWHHRVAQALSSAMMPLMAVFVGFGIVRGGGRVGRVVLGMATGFSYFVLDNYLVALGSMGVMPPLMASYAALVVFILGGLSFLVRLD